MDAGRDFPFPTLTTSRLILRELAPSDQAFLARLDSDEAVMKHINSGAMSLTQALRYADIQIEMARRAWHFHKWLVEIQGGSAVGWVQITKYRQEHRRSDWGDDLQIGYEFAPEHWGKGYATEACRAVIEHVFTRQGLDRLVAYARPENETSVRVLSKLGFQADGFVKDDGRNECVFYILKNPCLLPT